MKHVQLPGDEVLVPVVITVRSDTAELLSEMAVEMESSVDEVLSSLAEDAVIGLKVPISDLDNVRIPDKCSRDDLINILE